MNPYRLRSELLAITRKIEDGGELTPELLTEIADLEVDFTAAVENYAKLIVGENYAASTLRQEAAIMAHKARNHEHTADKYKAALLDLLKLQQTDRVTTDLFVVGVHKSPPSAAVRDGVTVDDLPEDYVRVKKEVNLQKVLEDFRNGVPLPDTVIVTTDNTHLKLRPR